MDFLTITYFQPGHQITDISSQMGPGHAPQIGVARNILNTWLLSSAILIPCQGYQIQLNPGTAFRSLVSWTMVDRQDDGNRSFLFFHKDM